MRLLRLRAGKVLRGSDRGAALPLVLVIFLVGFALVSAFLVAIVSSAQVSQTTRANIQAHAAAEAGIAAAQVKLPELAEQGVNICTPFPEDELGSETEPKFTVTGSCDLSEDPATLTITSSGEAENGDIATVEAVFAIDPPSSGGGGEEPKEAEGDAIVSIGGGNGIFLNSPQLKLTTSDGNPTRVVTREPMFTCNGLVIPGAVLAAGDVATSPCVVNGDLHVAGLLKTNNSDANAIAGDVRLAGSAKIPYSSPAVSHMLSGTMGDSSAIGRYNVYANGNVQLHYGATVVYGDLNVSGTGQSKISGTVKGDVFTNGTIEVTGTVGGDIEARGSGVVRITGTVTGDIRTDGTVLLDSGSRVQGSIVALGAGSNTFKTAPTGSVQAAGAVVVDGWGLTFRGYIQAGATVSFTNTKVQGVRPGTDCNVTRGSGTGDPWSQGGSSHRLCDDVLFPVFPAIRTVNPLPDVDAPVIDTWRDYEFAQADWLGFTGRTVSGSECDAWRNWPGSGWGTLSALETNTVIDLRACGSIQFNSWGGDNANPKLGVDVALIVDRMSLNSMTWSAKTGTTPRLWVVDPGAHSQTAANCNAQEPAVGFENVKIDDPVRAMIYTPAGAKLSRSNMVGSVYSGSVCIGGATTLSFAPMGLPIWGAGDSGAGGGGSGNDGSGPGSTGSAVPQIIGGISAAPLSLRDIDPDQAS